MCDVTDQLNLSNSSDKNKRSGNKDCSSTGNSSVRIKTSSIYGHRRNPQGVKPVPKLECSKDFTRSKQDKIFSKSEITSETKLVIATQKASMSVNKHVQNVLGKTCDIFCSGKGNSNGRKKVPVGKIKFTTSPVVKSSSRKRHTVDIMNARVSQAGPCKKPKFDLNMNSENVENCGMNNEPSEYSLSDHKLVKEKVTWTRKRNAVDYTCTEYPATCIDLTIKDNNALEAIPDGTKSRIFNEQQSGVQSSRSSAEKLKSEKVRTKDKERDSGFQETFRILLESSEDSNSKKQCSSSCSSPILFSPVSSSSGFVSSSNSRTCSPDQQSRITKYFSPIRGEMMSSPPRNVQVSPGSERTGKKNSRAM